MSAELDEPFRRHRCEPSVFTEARVGLLDESQPTSREAQGVRLAVHHRARAADKCSCSVSSNRESGGRAAENDSAVEADTMLIAWRRESGCTMSYLLRR